MNKKNADHMTGRVTGGRIRGDYTVTLELSRRESELLSNVILSARAAADDSPLLDGDPLDELLDRLRKARAKAARESRTVGDWAGLRVGNGDDAMR